MWFLILIAFWSVVAVGSDSVSGDADSDATQSDQSGKESNIHIDKYLEPLDGPLYSSVSLDYGARYAHNGRPNGDNYYLSFGVMKFVWDTQADYALNDNYSIRPKISVSVDSDTAAKSQHGDAHGIDSSSLYLLDVNEQSALEGLSLKLRQYVLHFVSKKHGIFSLGRTETLDRSTTEFLSLGSGIDNRFYQTASGVRLYNKDDQTFLGRFTNGTGKLVIPSDDVSGGTGLRLWGINKFDEVFDGLTYSLPYKDWLLQLAYANVPGDYADKYYQLGARYTYDALWARMSILGNYASSWPDACQTSNTTSSDVSGGWVNCQYTGIDASSPYSQFTLGSKLSLGYVDASLSFRALYDSDDDAERFGLSSHVRDYYAGIDYTFMDATEFGPLSMGLGFIKQNKLASLVGQSTDAYSNSTTQPQPLSVKDSKSYGLIFSMNQKLGYNSGVRLFWEQFGFSAIRKDNSLKIKASPVRLAVLNFYTNIDQWYLDKR